jgi:hypothetical protein
VAKKVLVHTCFNIADGERLNGLCACYQIVTPIVANRMVAENVAAWVTDGEQVSSNAICVIGGSSRRTPRAATIDAKHIARAYVSNNLEDKARIDVYGELTKKVWTDLVKEIPTDEFEENKNKSLNIPVLQFIGDNRTPGGVSEEN